MDFEKIKKQLKRLIIDMSLSWIGYLYAIILYVNVYLNFNFFTSFERLALETFAFVVILISSHATVLNKRIQLLERYKFIGPAGPAGAMGMKGDKGDPGDPFTIYANYFSMEQLHKDVENIPDKKYVVVFSGYNHEIALLYYKHENGVTFVRNLSTKEDET